MRFFLFFVYEIIQSKSCSFRSFFFHSLFKRMDSVDAVNYLFLSLSLSLFVCLYVFLPPKGECKYSARVKLQMMIRVCVCSSAFFFLLSTSSSSIVSIGEPADFLIKIMFALLNTLILRHLKSKLKSTNRSIATGFFYMKNAIIITIPTNNFICSFSFKIMSFIHLFVSICLKEII